MNKDILQTKLDKFLASDIKHKHELRRYINVNDIVISDELDSEYSELLSNFDILDANNEIVSKLRLITQKTDDKYVAIDNLEALVWLSVKYDVDMIQSIVTNTEMSYAN